MAPKRKWRKNSGRGVKRSDLREIRVETSSESEDDFVGFIEYDTEDNKKWTEKTVSVLQRAQGFQDEFDLAGPSTSMTYASGTAVSEPTMMQKDSI